MIDDLERIDNERFGETSDCDFGRSSLHQRAVMFTPRDSAEDIAFITELDALREEAEAPRRIGPHRRGTAGHDGVASTAS